MLEERRMKKYIREAILSVKELIDNRPLLKKSITDLANEAGIGRNILQKGFKELFKTTIKEYRTRRCMEKARLMLEEGRLSRKQIAYHCGYTSASNFSTAFKKVFGITPMQYKEQYC